MSDDFSDRENGEEKSFAEMFESFDTGMNENIRVGQRISGKIISIGRDAVFVDTGTKIDGVVDKAEILDENGEMPYKKGDVLDLYVVSFTGGEIRLSKGLSGVGSTAALRSAFEESVPLEGKVKGLIKGGFHVEVMQTRAFCPMGQMDLSFVERPDEHVGKTYLFLITQFEEGGKNVVVSRRELLKREQEKAREAFCEGIAAGSVLDGRVTKVMPYGAFVELFPGVDGMVHISELSWSRLEKSEEAVKKDDRVTVKVLEMEKGTSGHIKISLSLKQVTGDPWEGVGERFHEGDKVIGKVKQLAKFGAFVEISPGIEGLVHISEMSYTKRVLNPDEIVKQGESVYVIVKEMDLPKRRISLSIKDAEGDPWIDVEQRYHVNQRVAGSLQKKEGFGWFVTLEPGVAGLIPKSRLSDFHSADGSLDKLREGDPVTVIVEEVKPKDRRITLGLADSKDEGDWRSFAKGEGSLGSFGEKLRNALNSKKIS